MIQLSNKGQIIAALDTFNCFFVLIISAVRVC